MVFSKRAKRVNLRRLSLFILFATITTVLVVGYTKFDLHEAIAIAATHWMLVVGACFFQLIYVLLKSTGWYISYRLASVKVTWFRSLKLFFVTALIDTTCFPSTILSDSFKFFWFQGEKKTSIVRSLATARVGALLSYVPFIVLGFAHAHNWISAGLISVATFLVLSLLGLRRWKLTGVRDFMATFSNFLVGVGCLLVSAARFLILGRIFGIHHSIQALFFFITAQISGLVSTVPMGLGVKEVTLGILFAKEIQAGEFITLMLLFRLTGEVISAIVGWLCAGSEVIVWRRAQSDLVSSELSDE